MKKKSKAGIIIAILIILVSLGIAAYYILLPISEDRQIKKEYEGLDLLEKYQENTDMIGWIQVEGTSINYPVMKGDRYLYQAFNQEYSDSGTPFVEDTWTPEDLNTLIYGHNMWMSRSMFNPLHKFEDAEFFNKNRKIKFYVIQNDGEHAEKWTFEISDMILTSVDTWNYSAAQFCKTEEELLEYKAECDERALYTASTTDYPEKMISLSTCSYHVKGKNGRLVLVGTLKDAKVQNHIDKVKK